MMLQPCRSNTTSNDSHFCTALNFLYIRVVENDAERVSESVPTNRFCPQCEARRGSVDGPLEG